jgi:signal transduction histidine kinase
LRATGERADLTVASERKTTRISRLIRAKVAARRIANHELAVVLYRRLFTAIFLRPFLRKLEEKKQRTVSHWQWGEEGNMDYAGAGENDRRIAEETTKTAGNAVLSESPNYVELMAAIAHEVSQPLSGIITNASTCLRMLAANPPNIDGARETARRTIRDGNRASDVVTRLRALFGKKQATRELVDINEAAREVIALLLSELQRDGVILRCELAEELPLVTGDRIQLQLVMLNLIRNASDSMSVVSDRPKGLVIRTEREQGDRVRLTVQDSGVGLAQHGVDRIFEAFYTTKSDGMGMGLFLSRSIIESHQGRLWAVSNSGPGATFLFSVPCTPGGFAGNNSLVIQTVDAKRIEMNL